MNVENSHLLNVSTKVKKEDEQETKRNETHSRRKTFENIAENV